MAQKINIWQKLFSNCDSEETSISIVKNTTIIESLKNEYGLIIQEDNITADELSKHHFRKLSEDEFSQLNQLFQFIPQIATNKVQQHAANAAFKAATVGTFRVQLDPGMHLCRSRLTPGAYRATGLSNATNQIAGNAELIKNDATLALSNAPQIALSVFNVASIATGQYFMSQINSKLSNLSLNINRVEKILDAQRHGALKTASQELSDIIAKISFAISDTGKTNSTIEQIHSIQRVASNTANTCQELILNEIHKMNADDKIDKINSCIKSINSKLIEYQYATQIYGIATLFEVHLRNITDPNELCAYRDQIDNRIQQFKLDYDMSHNAVRNYIDETHALNDRSITQWVASGAAGVFSSLATGGIGFGANFGEKAFALVDDLFTDHRKQQKEEIAEQVNNYFESLKDTSALESPSSTINYYLDTVGQKIEFLKIGDNYYTNLPNA